MAYITCINIIQGAGSYQGNIHMQVQLNVCSDVKYGDFLFWTEGEMAMERITIDREFKKCRRVEPLFTYGALSEIVGKWYTRKHVADKDGVV